MTTSVAAQGRDARSLSPGTGHRMTAREPVAVELPPESLGLTPVVEAARPRQQPGLGPHELGPPRGGRTRALMLVPLSEKLGLDRLDAHFDVLFRVLSIWSPGLACDLVVTDEGQQKTQAFRPGSRLRYGGAGA